MKSISIIIMALILPACSNQQLYNAVKSSAEQQCYQLPLSEVDTCLERNSDNYNEYNRKRTETRGY
ncbi:hypothetical protein MNBD_GAMMA22-105 [hydrothermal vent metagenome]|uniref:Uncharacterized protein n=1 Tax=hydrothermal vent metagenome TaxID=652676 RepID=A0A3B1A890_9ZZZZ